MAPALAAPTPNGSIISHVYHDVTNHDPPQQFIQLATTGLKALLTTNFNGQSIELPAQLKFDYQAKLTTRFGTRTISEATKESYEKFMMQLWKFLIIICDYSSMRMLLATPPRHCPSMNVQSIRSFQEYKRRPQGTLLFKPDSKTPVTDALGKQMKSQGGWQAPGCTLVLSLLTRFV
jgi:hypothetical protein